MNTGMNCENYEIMINEFIDGALDRNKEGALFTHFSQCERCREDFKIYSRVQVSNQNQNDEYPEELDQRIFATIKERKAVKDSSFFKRSVPAYFLYASVIPVLVMAAFLFFQSRDYTHQMAERQELLTRTVQTVCRQEIQLERLIENIPSVKVKAVVDNPELLKKRM